MAEDSKKDENKKSKTPEGSEEGAGKVRIKGYLNLPYDWTFGRCATVFFKGFRDDKKIWGTRCSACGMVTVPPYSYCGRCFAECREWVEIKDEGVLTNFVVQLLDYPGQPVNPPFILARIRLDGSDIDFTHVIGEADAKDLVVGKTRVKAVWREDRTGILTDIKYFKPIGSEGSGGSGGTD
jgi:uncharacterized OB-fold protein